MNFLSSVSPHPTIFSSYIKPILINSDQEILRDRIKLTARAVQLVAAASLIITVPTAVMSLVCILNGGPLLSSGLLFIVSGPDALVFYDLFQLANNVASIFASGVVSRYCTAVLKDVSNFTNELTKKTIILYLFNPMINETLNMEAKNFA